MDVVCVLEQTGQPPPAYFRQRTLLDAWVDRFGLPVVRNSAHTLVLSGWRRTGIVEFWFTQVWVRASYTKYRKQMKGIYLKAFRASSRDLEDIHADHVINLASVAEDAWVQLFPVPARVNQMFGAKIEQFLPRVDLRLDRADLPPLIFFKLFCRTVPKSEREWEEAIKQVRDQILPVSPGAEAYRDHVDEDVRRALKRDFSNARRLTTLPGRAD